MVPLKIIIQETMALLVLNVITHEPFFCLTSANTVLDNTKLSPSFPTTTNKWYDNLFW